ncbi:hypothetical protein C0J52_03380 [Blattella germanica]|nr:hypothetical protein C0J52_03380 [Blattella germanica]
MFTDCRKALLKICLFILLKLKLYHSVIEDVIAGVRDSFLDEGVDEQVLQELKQIWESKLISSIATVFTSNQHGGQQGIVAQQTQMVQQTTVQAQNLQAQTQAQGVPQQGQPIQATTVITDPNRQVPIHITLPASQAGGDMPRVLTIQVPCSALQEILEACCSKFKSVELVQNGQYMTVWISGMGDTHEPLNSEDDVSDDDPTDLFDTDNVVVCQYDKITRSRNKWKFHLKDGIMNLSGKDYIFQKANGDAEW